MAHDVFISHSSKDKLTADAICHSLEQNGISCWIAPRDVRAGFDYPSEIMFGIENCKLMVLIFSEESNKSPYVYAEVERAFSKGKMIIPYRLSAVEMNRNLELILSGKHWIDAYPNDTVFANLMAAAKNVLGMPIETDEAKVPPITVVQPTPAIPVVVKAYAPAGTDGVVFRDKIMEKIVRAELQIGDDEPLDEELLSTVNSLRVGGDGIGVRFSTYMHGLRSLSTGKGLVKVGRGNLRLLSDVVHMPILSELVIPFQSIADVSKLSPTKIKKLDLSANTVIDLSPIGEMRHLKELCLDDVTTDSFAPVLHAKTLSVLRIGGECSQAFFNDLCRVGSESLTSFSYVSSNLERIQGIEIFPNLEFLNLHRSKVTDFSPLGALKHLTNISFNDDIGADFSVLKELPALIEVKVTNAQKERIFKLFGGEPTFKIIAYG